MMRYFGLIGFLLLRLGACTEKPPTEAEVIGRWVASPSSMGFLKTVAGGSPVCEITFNADGTFVTPGVPDYLASPDDLGWGSGILHSGKGEWKIEKYYDTFIAHLFFDEIDGRRINFRTNGLMIDVHGWNPRLWFMVFEEGEGPFEFVRAK